MPGVCPVGWCSQLPLLALRSPSTRVIQGWPDPGLFVPHEAPGTYHVGQLSCLAGAYLSCLAGATRSCLGLEMHSDVTKWSIILI